MRSQADAARDHAAGRIALANGASLLAEQSWSSVDPDHIVNSWAEQLPTVAAATTRAQYQAAASADAYVSGFDAASTAAELVVAPATLAGVASDGRSLIGLLTSPAFQALQLIGGGMAPADALQVAGQHLDVIVQTQVADAGRVADGVALTAHARVDGYIRVVAGGACSRCVILSGRWYRWNQGFLRHPHCHCVHEPAARDADVPSPQAIYDELTAAQRRRAGWSAADQQAIEDGADLTQVTNAARGVYTAGGRRYTRVGTTRRAAYGGYRIDPDTGAMTRRARGDRAGPRRTPEQIYVDAGGDRDRAIRMLRQDGYLRATIPTAPAAPAGPERVTVAGPSLVQQGIARQRLIDEADPVARNAIRTEQVLHDGGGLDVAAELLEVDAEHDPTVKAMLDAVRAPGATPTSARTAVRRLAATRGLAPISRAGTQVRFDPDRMRSLGRVEIAAGDRVVVLEPGYVLTLPNGDRVVLEKALVSAPTLPPTPPVTAIPPGDGPLPNRAAKVISDILADPYADGRSFKEAQALMAQQTRDVAAAVDGTYGRRGLKVAVTAVSASSRDARFEGTVVDPRTGAQVGRFTRYIERDPYTELLTVYHSFLELDRKVQGSGFAEEFNRNLYDWYRRSEVDAVMVHADIDVGGYTWATQGFEFRDRAAVRDFLAAAEAKMRATVGVPVGLTEAQMIDLDRFIDDLKAGRVPVNAAAIAQFGRRPGQGGRRAMWPGKWLMLGSDWQGRLAL